MKKILPLLFLLASLAHGQTTIQFQNISVSGTASGAGFATLLGPYLTSSSAASTYLTQSSAASTYLTQTSAASIYAPQANPTFSGTVSVPGTLSSPVSGTDLTGSLPNPTVSRAGNLGLARVIAQSGSPASVTNTTSETVLATVAIPANSMGANGMLRISCLWQYTNSSNSKPLRIRLGSVSGSTYLAQSPTTSTSVITETWIRAAGATNSQIGGYGAAAGNPFAVATGSLVTSSVDMTQAQNLYITGQPGATTDSITLLGYTVEVLNP